MDHFFERRRRNSQDLAGKEIYEIKPVILGGSPTDPANTTLLSGQEHNQSIARPTASLDAAAAGTPAPKTKLLHRGFKDHGTL